MSRESVIKGIKRQLRLSIKKKLCEIPMESIEIQSIGVSSTLLNVDQFKDAKRVALYMNMPNLEVQTMDLIKKCFELNKRVYLPRCNTTAKEGRKKNYLSMLEVSSFDQVLQLKPQGKYDLLEPTSGNDIMDSGDLDLIIMPGVGFSKLKKRLGHGAGFYDEFLTVYSKKFNNRPYLIGVGLKEQLVEDLPTEEHDWNLDCLAIGDLEIIQ